MSISLPWFRMYTDFLNDPKMIALSFEDQRHFIGILALKSDGALDTDCDPDLLNRIVAQRLWIDHAIIKEVKKRLVRAGLINEEWQPLAWDKRQFKSDSSKERVAKFRAKKQQESSQRYGNGEVTLQKRPSNAIDTDTEADTDKNPLTPLAGGESPETEKPKRKTRIQLKTFIQNCKDSGEKAISEYKPLLDYVDATGLPMEYVQIAWETFKDEFGPGGVNENRLQADWRRHFLNYVKKGYYRLWYAKTDGSGTMYMLTTQGVQAQALIAHREAA